MAKQKRSSEHILRQRLQAHEFTYNEQAWEALQNKMAGPARPEKEERRRWLLLWPFWFNLLGFAVVASAVGIWLFANAGENEETQAAKRPAGIESATEPGPDPKTENMALIPSPPALDTSAVSEGQKTKEKLPSEPLKPMVGGLGNEQLQAPRQSRRQYSQPKENDVMKGVTGKTPEISGTAEGKALKASSGFLADTTAAAADMEKPEVLRKKAEALSSLPMASQEELKPPQAGQGPLFRFSAWRPPDHRDAIFLEALGSGLIASVHYEKQLTRQPGLFGRVGVGYWPEYGPYLTIPVGMSYAFRLPVRRSYLELGSSLTFARARGRFFREAPANQGHFNILHPYLAYRRYGKRNLVWRVQVGPSINMTDDIFLPWFGVSIGKTLN